jgi:hypothetical protein
LTFFLGFFAFRKKTADKGMIMMDDVGAARITLIFEVAHQLITGGTLT